MKLTSLAPLLTLVTVPAMAQHPAKAMFDGSICPDQRPFIIVQDPGYSAKIDLGAEAVAFTDPFAPPKIVATDQAGIMISSPVQLCLQIHEGQPSECIETLEVAPVDGLPELQGGPIQTPADPAGQKVNLFLDDVEKVVLDAMQFIENHLQVGHRNPAAFSPERHKPNERAWIDTLPLFSLRMTALDIGRNIRLCASFCVADPITGINPIFAIAIDVTAS
ncbi:ABC transporter substrate-binding protein [uncultured Roseobacter sp.]|uniref:ABC transporter substrate-binding protein n=1 Tax=uncultured Roseobacter sp. TaxID=114847 RepID=UPI00260B0DDF|nr:ABC transporter substrate-binding protein [uncultured Roseobacter sp.]